MQKSRLGYRCLVAFVAVLLALNPVLPALHGSKTTYAQEEAVPAASREQTGPSWSEAARARTVVSPDSAPADDTGQLASASSAASGRDRQRPNESAETLALPWDHGYAAFADRSLDPATLAPSQGPARGVALGPVDRFERPVLTAGAAEALGAPLALSDMGVVRVATTGTDVLGCGSVISPCLTVQYAVDQALAGDSVLIATGVYTNPDMAAETRFVTIDKELTLAGGYTTDNWDTADPVANPTVFDGEGLGPVVLAETAGITVTLSGLTLQRGSSYGVYMSNSRLLMMDSAVISTTSNYGVYLSNSGGSLLQDSRIAGNSSQGVYAYSSNDLVLSGNTITGNGYYGIYLNSYNNGATLSDNTITGNSNAGVYFYRYNDYVTLEGNTISGNGSRGVYLSSSGNDYLTLAGNTIAGNTGDGLYLYGGTGYVLDNNLIAGNGGDGLYWSTGSGVLRHNTFSDNTSDSGVKVTSNAALVLTNTIVANQVYGIRTTNVLASVETDHTLWYNNGDDTAAYGGVNISTANDLYGDPAFVGGLDPFAAYHIGAGSAAIDAGVETGLSTDIDGQHRAPDIGADEFPYVLNLTPDQQVTTDADTVVTYTHSLRNSGGVTDTVALTADSSQGWSLEVQPLTVTLESGAVVSVTLTVVVPPGSSGQVDSAVITATSTISPANWTTARDVTLVDLGVQVEPDQVQTAASGTVVTYSHTITNSGAISDTFALDLSSSRGWAALATGSPVAIGAGASVEAVVLVTVPVTAAMGLVDATVLTATSVTVPEVMDRARDETTAGAVAGTRYVATTGSDAGNSCLLSADPCGTVWYAVDQALAGDSVLMAGGVYTNPDMAVEGRLVAVDKTLTLAGGYTTGNWDTADPEANPTVLDAEGLGTVVHAETVGITVTLSGLTMQRGTSYGVYMSNSRLLMTDSAVISTTSSYGVYLSNSDGSLVQDSRFASNSNNGLGVTSSDDLVLSGNTISGNGYYGIYLNSSNNRATLSDNTITGNSNAGVYFYRYNDYVTLEGNTISGNGSRGVYLSSSGNDYLTLAGNTIAGNTGDGLYLYGGTGYVLDNNLIAGNGGDGLYWSYGSGVLRHNTFSDNTSDSGVQVNGAALVLTNTIIANQAYGIRTISASASVQADHTLWYNNGDDVAAYGGVNISTANDLYGDPAFVGGLDPFAAYHISRGSAAIDAGVETGLSTDIDGQHRAPDIGADEFPYVLNLTPDQQVTTDADIVVTYTHSLRNSGGVTDTVALTADSSQGWSLEVQPLTVTLESGAAVSVTLTVVVPPGSSGQVDRAVITATSTISPANWTTARDVTLVDLGVQVEPDQAQTAASGTVVTYSHTITNSGAISDTFALDLSSSRGWAALATGSPVAIGAGASAEAAVRVTVPLTAAMGLVDTTVLTATSVTVPEVMDTARDETTAGAVAGTRYVATTGSDAGNSCLLSTDPCGTVGYAVDQALAGDSVLIATGVYTNPDMAVEGRLAVVDKTLTLVGGYTTDNWDTPDPEANPTVLDGEGLGTVVHAETVGITVTLSGLTMQRGTSYGLYMSNSRMLMTDSAVISTTSSYGVYLYNSDGSLVQDSRIAGNGSYGVYVYSSEDFELSGNKITDNGYYGIYLNSSNNRATFSHNTITGNGNVGIYINSYNDNVTLEGNAISGNGSRGVYLSSSGNDYLTLAGNTIAGNTGDGLYLYGGTGYVLDNNLIAGNGGHGIAWYTGSGMLRHNTLSDNTGDSGLRVAGSAVLVLTNNIISGHIYGIRTTSVLASVEADHTLWYNNGDDTAAYGGVNVITTNDLHGDPAFVGGADPFAAYHIGTGSAAIDAGVETGLSTDIDGQRRAPDIGADEFPYALHLAPDQQVTTNPDTVVTYTHSLRNSGGVTDTVALTAGSSQGWSLEVQPLTVTLESGAAVSVTLTVVVPPGSSGQVDRAVITATSTISPANWTTAGDVTLVDLGVQLEPDRSQVAAPGSVLTYTHTLTNAGDSTDTFALSLASSLGWAELVTGSPVTLDAGASAEVAVRATVPVSAAAGVVDATVLTATSVTVPEVMDRARDETTAGAVAGTRYVATTGSDAGNSCLLSTDPCGTVWYAVDQALAGDSVLMAGGVYTNPDMAVEGRLVAVDKTLTLAGGYTTGNWDTADPEANPTVLDAEGLGTVVHAETVGITVTLSGLSLQRGTSYGVYMSNSCLRMMDSAVISTTSTYGVYLSNSDGSLVQDSRIAGTSSYGLYAYSSDDLVLSGNTITGNGSYAVYLNSSNNRATFSDNTITDNNSYAVYLRSSNYWATFSHNTITDNGSVGLYLYQYNDNMTLEGNTISGNGSNGLRVSSYGNDYLTLVGNTLAGNTGDGLYLYGGAGYVLDNNLIAGNGGDGIEWPSGSGTLRHNTLSDNTGDSALRVTSNAALVLTNTIISGHTCGILTTYTSANVQADHTLWFGNGSDTDSTAGGTITRTNDRFGDPSFAGGADPFEAYHISIVSAALDNGVDAGLYTDIDGQSRPYDTGFDIGADEYPGEAVPPADLVVAGPLTGTIQFEHTFTATVNLITTTLPITYQWEVEGQPPVVHVGNRSDSATIVWHQPGPQVVTVSATNEGGTITATHAITISAPPAASLPYYDGFESGMLGESWLAVTREQGRVQVGTYAPYAGSYGVLLDDAVSDSIYSTASLVLTIDLAGQPSAVLDFRWREFGDENHAQDGVFVSDNYGATWHQTLSFNDGPSIYRQDYVDLGAAAAAHGLAFNDHFQIKFQFYDDLPIPYDGYGIDEVRVISALPVGSVAISGPTTGIAQATYTFTATTSLTTTPPVVYVWEATSQPPITHTSDLNDLVQFTWPVTGTQFITVTAANSGGSATASHSIVLGEPPAVSVEPAAFDVIQNAALVTTQPLTIYNGGLGPLDFDLTTAAGVVAVDPISGTIVGPGQAPITVTFDTTTLPDGVYYDQVLVASNDPVTPLLTVPITLTVILVPPEIPSDPSPLDGEINVRVDKALTWEVSPHAASYDLYLWEDGQAKPETPTASDLTGALYDPPTNLPTGTMFHWQVVARNAVGDTLGPEWTFTVETLPDLEVTTVTVPPSGWAGQPIELGWIVTNIGDRGTTELNWYDRVYISLNATWDPVAAIYLGTVKNPAYLGPGESYLETATFDLPQGISGDYYTFVQADCYAGMRESDETNNRGRSAVTSDIQVPPMPDLQVVGISAPANAFSGEPISVTWAVRNEGSGDVQEAGWYDRVYLSPTSTLDINIADNLQTVYHSGALEAGEAYTPAVTINLPQAIYGEAYLFIITDIYDTVYEYVWEGNNTSDPSDPINITLSPPPDLEVTSLEAPSTADSATAITVDWTVTNNGAGAPFEDYWQDRVYLSSEPVLTPTEALVLGTFDHWGVIQPGEFYTRSQDLTLPVDVSGTHYVHVWTDYASQVFEYTYEDNNVTSSAIDITLRPPDLVVSGLAAPGDAESGDTIHVAWDVTNQGTGVTFESAWQDQVFLSPDAVLDPENAVLLCTFDHEGQLNPGTGYSEGRDLTLPNGITGTYYLHAWTDYDNDVFEHTADDNNITSVPLAITLAPSADLHVPQVAADATSNAGGLFHFGWTVANAGSAGAASPWQDRVYLSTDMILDTDTDIVLGTYDQLSSLQVSEQYTQSHTAVLSGTLASGTYYVLVNTDSADAIYEHNGEDNNVGISAVVTIAARPATDLVLGGPNAPVSGASGQPIAVSWSVTNTGSIETMATSWTDAAYLSDDPVLDAEADALLGNWVRSGALGSGASYARSQSVNLPNGIEGEYYLFLLVDSQQQVDDSNRTNNRGYATPPISVTLSASPDLVPTLLAPPSDAVAGQPLLVEWSVANEGVAAASGIWYDAIYLSDDPLPDTDDVQMVSLSHFGGLDAASAYTTSATIRIPSNTTGSYYLLLRSDSNDVIYEHQAEANNLVAWPITVTVPPPADLVVTSVTVPSSAVPGEPIVIDWTLQNVGVYPASGTMCDAVYISADDEWQVTDAHLEDDCRVISLDPGEIETLQVQTLMPERSVLADLVGELTENLPGVTPGQYYAIVRTDILNQIRESDETNNAGASDNTIAVDVAELALDVPASGTLGTGESQFYRVDVPAGETLMITLDSDATDAANELYVRYGNAPSRGIFDYAYDAPFEPDQEVVVPTTQSGTYYLLLYGDNVPGGPQPYTISAELLTFELRGIAPQQGGQGKVTVRLDGALLGPNTTVSLDNGSVQIAAEQSYWFDASVLYATFDLSGAPLAVYDLNISDGVQAASLNNAFQVVPTIPSEVQITAYAPNRLRPGEQGTLVIGYANAGNTDLLAPILNVTAENSELQPPGQSEFVGSSVQLVGIAPRGPAGILPPGTGNQISLVFRPLIMVGAVAFSVSRLQATDGLIDWSSLKDDSRPDYVPVAAWNAVWSNFTASVGQSASDLLQATSEEATHLSLVNQRVYDFAVLLMSELQQATNPLPRGVLVGSLDATLPTPGLQLEFNRAYMQPLTGRFKLGPLGRGWTHQWEISAQAAGEGDAVMIMASGGIRYFLQQPDGSFRGIPGENGTLALVDGSYRLRETTGIEIVFLPDGRWSYVEDPNGNRITATYTDGRLIRLLHSNGSSIALMYNAVGRISQVVDSAGRGTVYGYDASGEYLLTATGPAGTITYTYDTAHTDARQHALLSVAYPGNTHRYFEYDTRGRLVRESRDGGLEPVSYSYDTTAGITISDATGASTKLLYNADGGVGRLVDPLGRVTQLGYDSEKHLNLVVTPLGSRYSAVYDQKGNLITETDPLGHRLEFTYEAEFNRVQSLRDPRGNTLTYAYDASGNLLSITHPDGSIERFTADQRGSLVQSVNRRGQAIDYTYNQAGLVTRKDYHDDSYTQFGYDSGGNLVSASDAGGTMAMYYDAANRLTDIEYPSGRSLEFTYDAGGRRTQSVDQDGSTVNYSYDAAGRLVGLTDGDEATIVSYSYDLAGRLLREDKGNGTYTTYAYDVVGQLTQVLNHAPDGSVNGRFDYTYDDLGRRIGMNTLEGQWTFDYDPTGQMTSVRLPGGRTIDYQYDDAGNRILVDDDGVTTLYAVNELNQYTSVGTATYGYDLDGNLTSKVDGADSWTYAYDSENRLVSADTPDGLVAYEYDALGNRISATLNGQRTEYLIDPVGLQTVAGEYDDTGGIIAHYTHGLGLVSRIDPSGTPDYYDFDGLGSTTGLTDLSGDNVNSYTYLPFGETLTATGPVANPFQYLGAWGVMHETGAPSFMRARYYDPQTGRFTSVDPLGAAGGDPNLYRYVGNNPQSAVDPEGTIGLLGGVVGGIVGAAVNTTFYLVSSAVTGQEVSWRGAAAAAVTGGIQGAIIGATGGLGLFATAGMGIATGAATGAIGYAIENAGTENWSTSGFWAETGFSGLLGGLPFGLPTLKYGASYWGAGLKGASWIARRGRWNFVLGLNLTGKYLYEKIFVEFALGSFIDGLLRWLGVSDFLDRLIQDLLSFIIRPMDPNDIVGPAGYGDAHWVAGDRTLGYTIHFENDPELATAPAQRVEVRQTLDSDLDPRSFRLGAFGFGDYVFEVPENRSFYSDRLGPLTITSTVPTTQTHALYVDASAGVDIVNSEVFWILQTIDPDTGAPPADPSIGFLPPDVNEGEGQGFVSYLVKPQATVATGDVVDALATIVFDGQEPLDTPPYFNTLDAGYPASNMDLLAAETAGAEVVLSWIADDDAGGSGVKDVDVYVSTDGAPFELWQAGVAVTATVFTGEPAHTYGFFTVAEDNAGNRESLKATAETTTTLFLDSQPALVELAADPAILEADGSSASVLSATVRDGRDQPLTGETVTFTSTLGTLSAITATTDISGTAAVTLTASVLPGTAVVTATAESVLGPVAASTNIAIEESIAGLVAVNDSPTRLGEATTLTATISSGSSVTYTWAFGDEELGNGAVVTHTYPATGIYTAVVTASNPLGELASTTFVTITPVSEIPLNLAISGPLTGTVDTGYVFTATVSPVTATLPITYTWITPSQAPVVHTAGLSDTVVFSWSISGTQALTVTATNANGTVTGTHAITICPYGDLDYDCDVDVVDIMLVVARWNTSTGDPEYDPAYDLDDDGDIDVVDIMTVAAEWGTTCGGLDQGADRSSATSSGPELWLLPPESYILPGEAITYTLVISGVENLGAYQMDILWDPLAVTLESMEPLAMLDESGNTVVDLGPLVGDGRLTFGAFGFGDGPGASGEGALALLTFRRLVEAETFVGLENVRLVDMEGQEVAAGSVSGAALGPPWISLYLPLILR